MPDLLPTPCPGVRATTGPGGLPAITVSNDFAEAEILLHGAHITRYRPAGGRDVLWMSRRSYFATGKPVRGGIPICWPWFGPHAANAKLPAHGFARISTWHCSEATDLPDGRTRLMFTLHSDAATLALWPHPFRLSYTVVVGATLELELAITNPAGEPFTCEAALHTYLMVGDIAQVLVHGLDGTGYIDKTDDGKRHVQNGAVRFIGETDRVYVHTVAPCTLDDPLLERRITIAKSGSYATVLWNPWTAKAARMPDFADDEWPGMVCIETAEAADHALTIGDTQTHVMRAVIATQPV